MAKKAAPPKKPEPSAWDQFKADPGSMALIFDHVLSGESLASFAKARGFAYVTVLDWINADTGRSENYTRAREARADLVFEQLDDVSDLATKAETAVKVQGLRLKSDNIKWKLARMAPKKYGEKLQLGGAADLPPVQTQSLDLRGLSGDELATMKQLLAKGKAAMNEGQL